MDPSPKVKQTESEDLSNFDDTLQSLFESRDVRDKRLFKILTSDDDLVTLVLRGHLVIEELLFAAIAAHCQEPDLLQDAHLKFSQLIPLIRSLEKMPLMKEKDWEILTELNSLRNALAHRIEPGDISARIERLVNMILGPEGTKFLQHPLHSKQSLKSALAHLFGRLSVITVFQSALPELIRYQLQEAAKNRSQKS